jgi:hypothetical protein
MKLGGSPADHPGTCCKFGVPKTILRLYNSLGRLRELTGNCYTHSYGLEYRQGYVN